MKINPEFEKLIPALTAEEFNQLELNCIAEGIREPLIVWNDTLIDGHNRYKIALKNNLIFGILQKDFQSESDVKVWMIKNQFGRRNLNSYQRSVLALELEGVFKEKAKQNLILAAEKTNAGLPNSAKAKNVLFEEEIEEEVWVKKETPIITPIDTRNEIKKIANVGNETISRVKVIQEKATPEQKEKLEKGEETINSVYQEIKKVEKKEERIQVIQTQIEQIENGELPELKGLFDVISVDPPWPYEGENKNLTSYDSVGRRVANPYPEMSIQQIKEIELPLMENGIVFLWTTHKFLNDAFSIANHWGLEYKATLVWNKEKIGMGSWLRMQCEFCLVCIKGKPYWNNTTYRDILTEPRREHSRKPDSFFEMVENITLGRKLEYFSREKRNNWEIFGNDTNKF